MSAQPAGPTDENEPSQPNQPASFTPDPDINEEAYTDALDCLKSGLSPMEIHAMIVEAGFTEDQADKIVQVARGRYEGQTPESGASEQEGDQEGDSDEEDSEDEDSDKEDSDDEDSDEEDSDEEDSDDEADDEQLPPIDKEAYADARQCLLEGRSPEEVHRLIVEAGYTDSEADQILLVAQKPEETDAGVDRLLSRYGQRMPESFVPDPEIDEEAYIDTLDSLLAGLSPEEVHKLILDAGYSEVQAEKILKVADDFRRHQEGRVENLDAVSPIAGGLALWVIVAVVFMTNLTGGPYALIFLATALWGLYLILVGIRRAIRQRQKSMPPS